MHLFISLLLLVAGCDARAVSFVPLFSFHAFV